VLHEREKTISKTNNRLMVFGFIIYSPLFIYNITILEVKSNKALTFVKITIIIFVFNENFEVHNYMIDGSIIPANPVVNPSLRL
jgi:hypothetical protein